MNELVINPELKSIIPSLTTDEYKDLEESIKIEGCRDALIIWGNTIIDGHNRYEICTKHSIAFRTSIKDFDDIEDVKAWMIKNQFGRRNLTLIQRMNLAFLYEDIIKAKARARQATGAPGIRGGDRFSSIEEKGYEHTDKELAKIAGVGNATIHRARVIKESGTEEQKRDLEVGKKTIGGVYEEIRQTPQWKEEHKKSLKSLSEKPKTKEKEVYSEEQCKPDAGRMVTTIQNFLGYMDDYCICDYNYGMLNKKEKEDCLLYIELATEELKKIKNLIKKGE